MGQRAIPRTWTKSKHRSLPIRESSPYSSFELHGVKTSSKVQSLASVHLQLAHPQQNPLFSNSVVKINYCSFPWLQYLSQTSPLIQPTGSSTLSSNLTELLHTQNYYTLLETVSISGGHYHPSVLPNVHFAVGYSFYKLKLYPQARKHFSECKSIAKNNEDVSYCCFYLGNISCELKSFRKAAMQYRKAAVYHSESKSSFATMFNLEQPSLSSIHLCSSSSFRQANRPIQALHESTEAFKFAESEKEHTLAQYECGMLYKLMANHVSALECYANVIEHADKQNDYGLITNAYKGSCSSCIILDRKDDALYFFSKVLSSVDLATNGSLPTVDHLKWVCETIGLLPICDATQYLPDNYICTLLGLPELISSQFRAELERVERSLQQVHAPIDTVSDSNLQTVIYQDQGYNKSPGQYFDDMFLKDAESIIENSSLLSFLSTVEIPSPPTLCHGLGTVIIQEDDEEPTINLAGHLWPFSSFPDPHYY